MPVKQTIEGGLVPVKIFTDDIEPSAREQLINLSQLPVVHHHVAAMPDVHAGIGATVGTVVATKGAIIPAAVGVDIGCGMAAVRTTLLAKDLPDSLHAMRTSIEKSVPHGFSPGRGKRDAGSWHHAPKAVQDAWTPLEAGYKKLVSQHPKLSRNSHPSEQLGTLGSGNHFIEVCL